MDTATLKRKRRKFAISLALVGLLIAAVFFAYFETDPRPGSPAALVAGGTLLADNVIEGGLPFAFLFFAKGGSLFSFNSLSPPCRWKSAHSLDWRRMKNCSTATLWDVAPSAPSPDSRACNAASLSFSHGSIH